METVTNVANAAARAVWGDSDATKEPVSGASGDVSKGEPYDAGNLDDSEQKRFNQDSAEPGHQTDSKPAPADTTAGQNDTRKPEDVAADEPAGDVTGPGPKPLETLAKEHGGDAGRDVSKDSDPSDDSADKKGTETSESKGTGEQYIKTSGLAADGGDFDATKPGAGREADRLMDQKGMQRPDSKEPNATDANGASESAPSSPNSSKKDKPSLGDRIKAKIHKH